MSKRSLPVQGIALSDMAAVRDGVFEAPSASEATAAQRLFAGGQQGPTPFKLSPAGGSPRSRTWRNWRSAYGKTWVGAVASANLNTMPQTAAYYVNGGIDGGRNSELMREARNTFRTTKSGADAAIDIGLVSNNSNGDGTGECRAKPEPCRRKRGAHASGV